LVLVASAECREGTSARQQAAAPVHVAVVRRIDAPVLLDASGVVEPMQTVAITAQMNGVLQQVAFHEGDYVTAGQVLFRIDPRPLQAVVAQARATLERDEAQVVAAQHDDERYAALAEKGYVSRSQAEQQHATARAQAASVAADRAALRAAELNLAYTTIRAPISGRTGSVLVRAGNVVTTNGTPLVVINQIKPVFVRFPIL
jgi:multidrug efflux system membrane fusion protein